jgi:hypothetical protein
MSSALSGKETVLELRGEIAIVTGPEPRGWIRML